MSRQQRFESVFREHYTSLCVYAMSILHDRDSAEDVVQQVFVSLWKRDGRIDWNGNIRAYLYRSVYTGALNLIRNEKVRSSFYEFLQREGIWEEEDGRGEVEELMQQVEEVIGQMPPQMREIFLLHRFSGKKSSCIADELGLSVRTVETQVYRAMRFLKERLRPDSDKNLLLLFFMG